VSAPPLQPVHEPRAGGVRLAQPSDDAQLAELVSSVPIAGSVSYRLERRPSYSALLERQGSPARVALLEEQGAPSAMVTAVARRVSWEGRPERFIYLCDARVAAAQRGQGQFGRLVRFLVPGLRELGDAMFFLTRADHPVLGGLDGREAWGLSFERLSRIRNYSLFYTGQRPALPDVRAARPEDEPALIALWQRVHGERNLAWVLEPGFAAARGLALSAFRVLERAGEIVAFGAPWDTSALKQVRLLGLSPALRVVRRIANPLARRLGAAPVAENGELLAFRYLAFACAAQPGDLRTLIRSCLADGSGGRYLYLDLALDLRDPLTRAVGGWVKSSLDFELYLVRWQGSSLAPARAARATHFEMALV